MSAILGGVAVGLNKSTAGTVILSGANTYTGTTAVSAGTLRLGAANRIADTSAVTVASGATFDLNSFAETVGSIAGAGNITLGTAVLTAGGDGTSTTFSARQRHRRLDQGGCRRAHALGGEQLHGGDHDQWRHAARLGRQCDRRHLASRRWRTRPGVRWI